MFYKIFSLIVKSYLMSRGIAVHNNFYCTGWPYLNIKGNPKNIIIGSDVQILGSIDIRNRENGILIVSNDVKIEHGCRFVTAKNGCIFIGEHTAIGTGAIWNGGGNINIGSWCVFSARSSINANSHGISNMELIRKQPFSYGDVNIEHDCFIGINAVINMNVKLKTGTVIGANCVVPYGYVSDEYSINVGVPAKKIAYRKE